MPKNIHWPKSLHHRNCLSSPTWLTEVERSISAKGAHLQLRKRCETLSRYILYFNQRDDLTDISFSRIQQPRHSSHLSAMNPGFWTQRLQPSLNKNQYIPVYALTLVQREFRLSTTRRTHLRALHKTRQQILQDHLLASHYQADQRYLRGLDSMVIFRLPQRHLSLTLQFRLHQARTGRPSIA